MLLPITFELTNNPNNVAHVKGTGVNSVLVLADPTQGSKFSGFGGQDYLELTIRAKNAGNGSYHASSEDRTIRIKAPSKSAFFECTFFRVNIQNLVT